MSELIRDTSHSYKRIKKRDVSLIFILALFSLFSLGLAPDNETIKVEASKKAVETGEIFTYKIKIEGDFSQPQLLPPEFENFQIISRSESQSYAYEGGRMKTRINFIYYLSASNPGTFTIQPTTLKDEGKEYKSESLTVIVVGEPLERKRKIQPFIDSGTNL